MSPRFLLPRRGIVPMFGDMNGQDALHLRAPQGRSPASFDAEFRRALRDVLGRDHFEREGIDPSRLGRIVVGDPGFVRQCLADGCDVQMDTADGVRVLIGEAPFRPQFCRELERFMALTGTKPWAMGWCSVRNASFVQRLQRGSSPNPSTVDRVRGWMHAQLRGGQPRTVFAAVTAPSSCPALTDWLAPAVKRCVQPH